MGKFVRPKDPVSVPRVMLAGQHKTQPQTNRDASYNPTARPTAAPSCAANEKKGHQAVVKSAGAVRTCS